MRTHKVTFATFCQCMTECKSVYFDELSGHMLKLSTAQMRCSRENTVIHRAQIATSRIGEVNILK